MDKTGRNGRENEGQMVRHGKASKGVFGPEAQDFTKPPKA